MQTDPYLEIFNLLDLYIDKRPTNAAFVDLGGVMREMPLLDDSTVISCHISHYLSNDLEQKWVRALHLELTSSLKESAIHERFRSLASDNLSITFAGIDETVLCTEFSREVLKVQAFGKSNFTQVFVSSQLFGFDADAASRFLANPLAELVSQNEMAIRLVAARSSRPAAEGQSIGRMLDQRWTVANVEPAMQRMVEAANNHVSWRVKQALEETDTGPTAYIQHVSSGDVIKLDSAAGYGQIELRASKVNSEKFSPSKTVSRD